MTTYDNSDDNNISYILDDICLDEEGLDITQLMENFENVNIYNEISKSNQEDVYDIDILITEHHNYEANFTMKQLQTIVDYYDLTKQTKIYEHDCLKARNMKKEELILLIIDFENNIENIEIVTRRKKLWFYLDELKSDKFTKKYILW
jgi:hypothetical protein